MGILKSARDKLAEYGDQTAMRSQIAGLGQARFLQNVMEWEGCDAEQAMRLCTGQTDPIDYEYTLGYKLADPIWSTGLWQQPGRGARHRAQQNFRKMLCPEEQELFDEWCVGKEGGKTRKQMKKEFKEAKKRHKDVDVSELDGDEDDE